MISYTNATQITGPCLELISERAHILVKLPVMQSFLGLCLDVMTFSEECTCLICITGL